MKKHIDKANAVLIDGMYENIMGGLEKWLQQDPPVGISDLSRYLPPLERMGISLGDFSQTTEDKIIAARRQLASAITYFVKTHKAKHPEKSLSQCLAALSRDEEFIGVTKLYISDILAPTLQGLRKAGVKNMQEAAKYLKATSKGKVSKHTRQGPPKRWGHIF